MRKSLHEHMVDSYLEQFVGFLLVLLRHGVGGRASGHADGTEDGETSGDTNSDTPSNASVGTRGVDSAGAVRTESNPVS